MILYPMAFEYRAEAGPGIPEAWQAFAPESRVVLCAIPPEFEGPGDGFSPEDFFGMALLNCFVATFKVIAERSGAFFESVSATGDLQVDRDEQGRPWMKAFRIQAIVAAGLDGDHDRLRRVFEKTSKSCIVANSVKTEVSFFLELA